ncbi:hypothetical protein SAMN05414137_108159 [Streptacidiphilus jiangxiensis]|uniref:Uncharacterized protein n=1 Tax=Streptacidiphilus jiangxiensis TaxID=235985 RepID=A0A1H7PW89_STRJI|nr:hypothetical protein SAMN05414137_108159 [Streptacidiphilus jiangxiensis]
MVPGSLGGGDHAVPTGCAARQWLVVSGPGRGDRWADDRVDEVDLAPVVDAEGLSLTLARWSMDWLNEAEAMSGLRSRPASAGSRGA